MKKKSKGQKKVSKVMREFYKGELHSGKSGKIVKSPEQAKAIAMSEASMSKPMMKKKNMMMSKPKKETVYKSKS